MKKETINASDLRKRVERHRRGYRSGKLPGLVFSLGGALMLMMYSAGRHSWSVEACRALSLAGSFFVAMGVAILLRYDTIRLFDDYLKSIEGDRRKEQDDATSP